MKNALIGAALVALALPAFSPAADAQQTRRMGRIVVINNQSPYVIDRFYATGVSDQNWDVNLLGTGVVMPGERRSFIVDDRTRDCQFDLKIETNTGVVVTNSGNVCGRGAIWTLQ